MNYKKCFCNLSCFLIFLGYIYSENSSFLRKINNINNKAGATIIAEADKYIFKSNIWVNLHHYLYEKARRAPRNYAVVEAEKNIYDKLPANKKDVLINAIHFYERNVVQKDLLFNDSLYQFKCWLAEQDQSTPLHGNDYLGLSILPNQAYDVYKNHFWPLHYQLNSNALLSIVSVIDSIEETVIKKMEKLSREIWPRDKINVDVTCYASWAGAYTNTYPISITQSFFDSRAIGMLSVEVVFHESSHLLIDRQSWLRNQIASEAARQQKNVDRNYWHAILFYMTGKLVQEEFKNIKIQYQEIYMKKNNVFARFVSEEFRNILDQYIGEDISGEFAVELLIENYKG